MGRADGGAEQAAEEVDSVLKYYPQLLRAKYGDGWEDLLGDDDDDDDDAAADAAGGDAADADAEAPRAAYVGEVEMDTDWEESEERVEGMTEEELAQLVATQQAEEDRLEAEGGGAADAADDGDDEDDDDDPTTVDEAALAAATALSDDLSSWSRRLALGDVSVPKPFPESEWLHVWACAAAPSRFVNLRASWANVRARLPANFDDFECAAQFARAIRRAQFWSLRNFLRRHPPPLQVRGRGRRSQRDGARAAEGAGGAEGDELPTLAEGTSVYVAADGNKPPSDTLQVDAVGTPGHDEVAQMIQRYQVNSNPEREVVFQSAAVFVDGEKEIFGYWETHSALQIADVSMHLTSLTAAHDDLFVQVCGQLGLKFVGSADGFEDFYELQTMKGEGKLRKKTAGGLLLKEKVLREATVLDADILKVSSFLNHMVDVELMEACGEELAERLQEEQATKVLTVEATGLLPAMFVGKALGLPVIFARKSRQIGVSDSYQASYKSQVKSSTSDVYVSTEYLTAGDRVIIIDDFLAGGTTADALIRICRMANARVVGCGFLIEKWSDAGRAFLSGYGLTLESLVTVQVENGLVKVLEGDEVSDGDGGDGESDGEYSPMMADLMSRERDGGGGGGAEGGDADVRAAAADAADAPPAAGGLAEEVFAAAEAGIGWAEAEEEDEEDETSGAAGWRRRSSTTTT